MKNAMALLCLAVLLAACNPSYQLLKTKKEATFKLSDYPTYGFYDIEAKGDTVSKNFEKNVNIIKDAIAKNLQTRGLDEARDPALKINIALNVQEQLQTRQTDFRTDGLPRYMGQRRYSWKSEEVVTGKYREGTIVIDLVDAANNRMVWQGGASGIIPEKTKNFTEDINQVIAGVVAKIP
ncbi:hypothetical protein GCM10010967_52990 [Dyadobacter beijingensis]|uniref:DUF4136 domain-containing protein n=1 Tax=Dyadobacter beijingensis TaxID=365489 RepID=A0ABQ2IIW1_9BACT|nr:DUF4136 domain-containing protein [Dyadobacter beijingensis]GGN10529.1 hypothetical protein GCM10010967_52990 [Dyadobacter beijingensis]